MKKSIITTIAVISLSASMASFASIGSFLNDAANTTQAVSSAVNGPTKLSVAQLKDSGMKYVNRSVEVKGKVIEMKLRKDNSYAVIIENNDMKIIGVTPNNPTVMLGKTIALSGTYNGRFIQAQNIGGSGLL